MILDQLSAPIAKGLNQGNSNASAFAALVPVTAAAFLNLADGMVAWGHAGQYAPQRLFLMPYCDGQAGASFNMRVYGWRALASPNNSQSADNDMIWIPYLLAEFACTSGNVAPAQVSPNQYLKGSEYLCDTISLTQGALGLTGYVNSTGPGTNLVASVLLEPGGPRYLQFDFAQVDSVPMNVLWARA